MNLEYYILLTLSVVAIIGYTLYTQDTKYKKNKLPFDDKFSKYKNQTKPHTPHP